MTKVKVRSFNKAREFARKLNLKSRYEWSVYCSLNNNKPDDIPDFPNEIYKDWKGWRNWLGQYEKIPFTDYNKAQSFVSQLGIKSSNEWKIYCNWNPNEIGIKPANIPASPHIFYKNTGWQGYSHWLGTNKIPPNKRTYRSFKEAKEFAHSLNLTSSELWIAYCKGDMKDLPKKPDNIPTNVSRKYRGNGWNGMNDFLNASYNRKVKRLANARKFEDARKFVQNLNLKNLKEWIKFIKGELKGYAPKPSDIPNSPELIYKESGWLGYGDWLGTYTIAPLKRNYRSFEESRDFARSLQLTSSEKWIEYCKGQLSHLPPKPDDIPTNVSRKYKNKGWMSYKDFLWSNIHRQQFSKFRSYEDARSFIHTLNLTDYKSWKEYLEGNSKGLPEKPKDIPANPAGVYKNKGWTGIGDWLGSEAFAYAHFEYLKFSEVKKFVRTLELTSSVEWVSYCKGELKHLPPKPSNIPANVVRKYEGKGWNGFKDFLWSAKHRKARKKFMPYNEAKELIKTLKITSEEDFKNYIANGNSPSNLPCYPSFTYSRKGWENWKSFLE